MVQLVYSRVKLPRIDGETWEYTITTSVHSKFSRKGDSGGPVLNTSNESIGIILGCTKGEPKRLQGQEHLVLVTCSYGTPISLVLDKVEARTCLHLDPTLVDLD